MIKKITENLLETQCDIATNGGSQTEHKRNVNVYRHVAQARCSRLMPGFHIQISFRFAYESIILHYVLFEI